MQAMRRSFARVTRSLRLRVVLSVGLVLDKFRSSEVSFRINSLG